MTVGSNDADDAEIMAFAKAHDYVVVTQDLDFGTMLSATTLEKPSVVQLRAAKLAPQVLGKLVILALYQMRNELEAGALLTVDEKRTRVRFLPFPSFCRPIKDE